MRALVIAVSSCLLACSPNENGQGKADGQDSSSSDSTSSSGAPPVTTTGTSSTTDASTSSTTVLDGMSTSTSDATSSTTAEPIACGEEPGAPKDCDDRECSGECSNGTCRILCDDEQMCTGMIVCPADGPCDIECSGTEACAGAMVACPKDHTCTLTCDGDDVCRNLVMMCGDGPCSVSCTGDTGACGGLELHCGLNDGQIDCNSLQQVPPPDLFEEQGSMCACMMTDCT